MSVGAGALSNFTHQQRRILEIERFKSLKDKVILSSSPKETLDDVFGYDELKDKIVTNIILPIKEPYLEIDSVKTYLFFGPTGSGKTAFAQGLLGTISRACKNVTLIKPTESMLSSPWDGHSEKNMEDLFNIARAHQPSIIFMDFICSFGEVVQNYTHSRVRSILIHELKKLNKEESTQVYFIGATDSPETLDKELVMSMEQTVYFQLPGYEVRKEMFKRIFPTQKYGFPDEFYKKCSRRSEGFSCWDIEHVSSNSWTNMCARVTSAKYLEVKKKSSKKSRARLTSKSSMKQKLTYVPCYLEDCNKSSDAIPLPPHVIPYSQFVVAMPDIEKALGMNVPIVLTDYDYVIKFGIFAERFVTNTVNNCLTWTQGEEVDKPKTKFDLFCNIFRIRFPFCSKKYI